MGIHSLPEQLSFTVLNSEYGVVLTYWYLVQTSIQRVRDLKDLQPSRHNVGNLQGGAPRVMSTYTHSESARVRVSRVSDYPCLIYYRGYDASRL